MARHTKRAKQRPRHRGGVKMMEGVGVARGVETEMSEGGGQEGGGGKGDKLDDEERGAPGPECEAPVD